MGVLVVLLGIAKVLDSSDFSPLLVPSTPRSPSVIVTNSVRECRDSSKGKPGNTSLLVGVFWQGRHCVPRCTFCASRLRPNSHALSSLVTFNDMSHDNNDGVNRDLLFVFLFCIARSSAGHPVGLYFVAHQLKGQHRKL